MKNGYCETPKEMAKECGRIIDELTDIEVSPTMGRIEAVHIVRNNVNALLLMNEVLNVWGTPITTVNC